MELTLPQITSRRPGQKAAPAPPAEASALRALRGRECTSSNFKCKFGVLCGSTSLYFIFLIIF